MIVVIISGLVLTGILFFSMAQAAKRADEQMEKLLETEKSKKYFAGSRNLKLRFAMLKVRGGECL